MKDLISRLFLFAAVAASFAAFVMTCAAGGNLELTVLVASVVVLAVGIALERLMPFVEKWNKPQDDVKTDIASAGILIGVVDPLLKFFAPVAIVSLYGAFSIPDNIAIFPSGVHFGLQLVLATLLIEFGRYWAHRWHHTNRYLWWLHAMHHSSERLYAVNNFRFHPLNYAINFCLGVFPLMLIGVPSEVLFGYLALSQPVLMLQHANIDLRSGWLNYIFSTNEVHRWHHSGKASEANNNYGNAFVIWDILFGTFKYLKSENSPRHIGLFSRGSLYPCRGSYVSQLLSMFSPQCCKA